MKLDRLCEKQPEDRGRKKRDRQVDDETLSVTASWKLRHDADEPRAILPANGQNRARLNDDLEHFGALAGVAEQRSGKDQMPGGRDRQKFGEPFDDAENQCDENGGVLQRRGRRRSRTADCRMAICAAARNALA